MEKLNFILLNLKSIQTKLVLSAFLGSWIKHCEVKEFHPASFVHMNSCITSFNLISQSFGFYRFMKNKIQCNFILYRYGREDEEVMGLKFCNEAIISLQQIWPKIETENRFDLSPLQVNSTFLKLKFITNSLL